MASSSQASIIQTYTQVLKGDQRQRAREIEYARAQGTEPGFISFSDEFAAVLGSSPKLHLLHERSQKFAHEAGVYIKPTNSVYFTGNFAHTDPVELYRIDCSTHEVEHLRYEHVSSTNANGACQYGDRVLYCCQGTKEIPSSLVAVDPVTKASEILIDNFHGREFNSVNDVVVHHATGDVLFTDPTYGWEQRFRREPELPSQVYCLRPSTGEVWCVADGFQQCNGLCFSPDYNAMYVTDTGAAQAHANNLGKKGIWFNPRLPSCIYVYDVADLHGRPTLQNRRVFAHCDSGVPDGIKCDREGNVYSGCGDGIHVWNKAGTLIGKILCGGMVANFNFSKHGIWIFAEERLLKCELQSQGALTEIEC